MDRHLAASLDRWLTTPPEYDECECEEDGCTCAEEAEAANEAELKALDEQAAYDMAGCKCGHERHYHGEYCFGNDDDIKNACRCEGFSEATE